MWGVFLITSKHRSRAFPNYSPWLSVIGPMESNWISSFGLFTGGRLFFSVLGIFGFILLPDILHGKKCRAARVILLMARCPLCKRLIIVVRRFFGTIILSSMKTRLNRLDNFLLFIWYSSGIISCCCLSRRTRVFSKLGSFVVSFISSCKSVEKFFSVSRTACSRLQSFFLRQQFVARVPSSHMGRSLLQRIVPNLSLVPLGPMGLGPSRSLFRLLPEGLVRKCAGSV